MTSFGKVGILSLKEFCRIIIIEKNVLIIMGGEIIMKSTGIVRKVDELGRVVIPIELRRTLDIAEKDALEIYVDDDRIVLKKYKPNMTCQVTGEVSDDNLSIASGKIILSPMGAKEIIKELEDYLSKQD